MIETIAAGALGLAGQVATNAANVKLGREQMRFQERMSSSAHQREVADLQKAGLNPMLGVMKGSGGSSTPVGAAPRVESAIGAGVSSALSVQRQKAEIDLIREQQNKVRKDAEAVDIQNRLWASPNGDDWLGQRLRAGVQIDKAEAERLEALLPYRVKQLLQELESSAASADAQRVNTSLKKLWETAEAENWSAFQRSTVGKLLPYYTAGAQAAKDVVGAIAPFRKAGRVVEELTEFGNSRDGETGYRRSRRTTK